MKDRIDFDREFDAATYEQGYFTGNGDSAYGDYNDAKGIVEEQYQIIHNTMVGVPDKNTVLDLGCAYGFGSRKLAAQGAERVVGIDISQYAIDKAKDGAPDKVQFNQANILEDNAYESFHDKAFGLCVGTELLEHIPSASVHEVLKNVARVAEWGFFVINARSSARVEAEEGIEHAKNDAGHLNHNSMTWWIKEFSRVGDIDYDLMTRFGIATIGVHGVDWHSRCIVVKFD